MTGLSLHQLTVRDTTPLELIDIAAQAGCTGACVFAHLPDILRPGDYLPSVARAMLPEMKVRMSDNNITIDKIDVFAVMETSSLDGCREGFEIGASLGARHAITVIYDTLAGRAAESLAKMDAMAAEYGLHIAIEFMPLTPGCQTIGQAESLARAVGRDNIGISVDILHLMRSGGTIAELAAVDPKLLVSAQLCDGPLGITDDYLDEARFDRQIAGAGEFPLSAFVAALPTWTAFDVETPLSGLQSKGVSPLERAQRAVSGARGLLP